MTGHKATYLDRAGYELNRLLSLQDREPFSKTYGCFDRTYWAWKFTDFAGARFQEAVCALAFLAAGDGGRWAGHPAIMAWIGAGLAWWRGLQHPDGSFDEAYPWERSLAATAFTTFYVGEGFAKVADRLRPDERAATLDAIVKAGDWLCRNDERHGVLSNHLAAAAAALETAYELTGVERFRNRGRYFVGRVLARQSSEGWYEEYGGFDPGYQTHAIFYLARIWQRTGDPALLDSLRRACSILLYILHPDRTIGGEYSSRNTEFYFPAGFEILAPSLPEAAAIAVFMRPAVAGQTAAGLAAMDSYNFLPLLNNYLFAAEAARVLPDDADTILPWRQVGRWTFPDAGILVDSGPGHVAIVGLSKGGTVKVFARDGRLLGLDCGYWTRLVGGGVASSQSFSRDVRWRWDGDAVELEVPFVRVNQTLMTPLLFLGFRLFCLTLGRLRGAAYWLKATLVKQLINRRRPVEPRLRRRIILGRDAVEIEDIITSIPSSHGAPFVGGGRFATIHMGSSRYFQPQDLSPAVAAGDSCLVPSAGGPLRSRRLIAPAALGSGADVGRTS